MRLLIIALALFVSSFVEYWVHRLAHLGIMLKERHWTHHEENAIDSWFRGWINLITAILPWTGWAGFLFGFESGIVVLAAELLYMALTVYAHELQHLYPDQVFWMKCPIHQLHHDDPRGDGNFGVVTDFWDRVFGTHSVHGWRPADATISLRKLAGIRWF
jgi:sterol desaturase/sphingolipid hydroxylase (fatty acid hydroxylase superfamily)